LLGNQIDFLDEAYNAKVSMARNDFVDIAYWAPRKLLSGIDLGGIMAIITQSDLIATVGQRDF
jgi:hypothetical protein